MRSRFSCSHAAPRAARSKGRQRSISSAASASDSRVGPAAAIAPANSFHKSSAFPNSPDSTAFCMVLADVGLILFVLVGGGLHCREHAEQIAVLLFHGRDHRVGCGKLRLHSDSHIVYPP